MMKLFRKDTMKKWGLFISSIIMLTFMLWGGQTYLLDQGQNKYTYAGKIFNRKISFEEYQKNFKQVEAMARLQYGDNFQKIQELLNLEGQTWDRMMLIYEANRRHIQIPDPDVIAAIENITKTPIDTPMARQNYENFIRRQLGVLPRFFEEGIRESLKIAQIYAQETAPLTVSDQEVQDAYRQKNEKVQISYALFPVDEYKKQITVDESKVKEFFTTHKDAFLIPPTVEVEYIDIVAPPTATALTKPEKTVIANEEIPSNDETDDATWQKTEALYGEILDGKDLALIAKDNSLVVEKSGPFTMEQPILKPGWTFPLVQKIFQSKVGAILEPVPTSAGFQILKIAAKNDAHLPEYDEVKSKVQEAWITEEAIKLSREKAQEGKKELLNQYSQFKNPDFVKIAKTLNLTLQQTPVFGRGEYLPTIGINKDFQEAAFLLSTEKPLSDLIETPKGYCFLHLDNVVAADMTEFDKEKEKFKEDLLNEKKSLAFSEYQNRLRIQANLVDNIAKIKEAQKPQSP